MLALNGAFSNIAQMNYPLQLSTLPAELAPDSEATSFTDVMASVQTEGQDSQNETYSDPLATQPYQSGSSLSVNSGYSAPQSSAQLSSLAVSSPDSQQAVAQTSQQIPSARGIDRAAVRSSIKRASADELVPQAQVSNTKPGDRTKHHRSSGVQNSTSSSQTSTSDAAEEVAGSAPANAAAPATSTLTASESKEPAGETTPRDRNSKAAESKSDLAFAVKIQAPSAVRANAPTSTNASTNPDSPSAGLSDQTAAGSFAAQISGTISSEVVKVGSSLGGNDSAGTDLSALTSDGSASQPAVTSSKDADASSADDVAAVTAQPDEPPATSQPLKTVQVQITGADDQKVDLKLVEKAGTLTMSVRSADGNLTKALQQSLPELTTKLSDQRIQAEWWHADMQTASPSQKQSGASSSGHGSGGQDQQNQNKNNSGQQGGRGAPQPAWLEELSTLRKSTQNGTQYSWQL